MTEHLDRGPRPEPTVLLEGEVAALRAERVLGPGPGGTGPAPQRAAPQRDTTGGEQLAGRGALRELQALRSVTAGLVDRGHQHGQDR